VLAPDLLRWADVADRGGDLAAEFRALAARPGCGRLRAVGAVWAVTASTGSRVADVLDSVGDAIEAEEQAADELAALMAGPRATVVVLALLPVAGIAIATAVGLHPLPVLVHRPVGRLLLAAAGALDLVGLLLMRRLALPQAQP
jgi:tight adherence protein B